ncbi:hypothetical protein MYD27_24345, partial [Escherichia coli]
MAPQQRLGRLRRAAAKAVGTIACHPLLLAERADAGARRLCPGRVEGAWIVRRLPILMREPH